MRQTDMFVSRLHEMRPDIGIEVEVIETAGDIDLTTPLDSMGGFGAFVRELNKALLSHDVDVTVNSLKDMPVLTQTGIAIPSVLPRGPLADVMLPCPLESLAEGARVGTSSVRRAAMLKRSRPDLVTDTLRGNVNTRIRKLEEGMYDAIILADAGMTRLGLDLPRHPLNLSDFTPAPGQGAVSMACREDDEEVMRILGEVNDPGTYRSVTMERRLMSMLGADCSAPVGILVEELEEGDRLRAMAFAKDGTDHRSLDITVGRLTDLHLEQACQYLGEVF